MIMLDNSEISNIMEGNVDNHSAPEETDNTLKSTDPKFKMSTTIISSSQLQDSIKWLYACFHLKEKRRENFDAMYPVIFQPENIKKLLKYKNGTSIKLASTKSGFVLPMPRLRNFIEQINKIFGTEHCVGSFDLNDRCPLKRSTHLEDECGGSERFAEIFFKNLALFLLGIETDSEREVVRKYLLDRRAAKNKKSMSALTISLDESEQHDLALSSKRLQVLERFFENVPKYFQRYSSRLKVDVSTDTDDFIPTLDCGDSIIMNRVKRMYHHQLQEEYIRGQTDGYREGCKKMRTENFSSDIGWGNNQNWITTLSHQEESRAQNNMPRYNGDSINNARNFEYETSHQRPSYRYPVEYTTSNLCFNEDGSRVNDMSTFYGQQQSSSSSSSAKYIILSSIQGENELDDHQPPPTPMDDAPHRLIRIINNADHLSFPRNQNMDDLEPFILRSATAATSNPTTSTRTTSSVLLQSNMRSILRQAFPHDIQSSMNSKYETSTTENYCDASSTNYTPPL